ncbi:MAG: ubiquitin-like small modifier protein 1 [Halanaeroarchaeum sp.]
MDVEIRLFATFRDVAGQKTLHWEFEEGATVETLLQRLESTYSDLDGEFVEDGEIHPQINVLKNGREVLHLDGLDTAIEDEDTISIFPPVAGG